jgi:hypothetical protein
MKKEMIFGRDIDMYIQLSYVMTPIRLCDNPNTKSVVQVYPHEVGCFSTKYELCKNKSYSCTHPLNHVKTAIRHVDWAAVAQLWGGIEFCEYDKNIVNGTSIPEFGSLNIWYSGIDCWSGCVWNPECISNVVEIWN